MDHPGNAFSASGRGSGSASGGGSGSGGRGGNELGAFLRSRRAALDPHEAGVPDDGRLRRVPGLRREELAQLAHVSIDYVVRLEQGRTRRVSRPILDALADALRLAPDERAYLFTLADVAPAAPAAPTRQPGRPEVAPRLRQLLDTMHDVPAMVLRRGMEVLAWNRGAAALLTDFGELPLAERNLIRLTFLDDAFRALYADWPRVARECVAVLRMEAGRTPDDPALTALVGELSVRDPDFRTWWASHQVRGPRQLTKTYRHPVAGTLTLDVQQFSVDTHPDQLLVAYTAEPDSQSQKALHFLLQWSADRRDDRATDLGGPR
ncbi:helix-turn-helix transcriptional regulator [Streptomyces sp. NBC_00878]|uniref:helix-turn-helix transcriptional regulator n=1 Tax=Streptomyces sp. NBC_00878 TaxID=2975854 RepID=UPI0022513B22|nr:helix-turn-helix transcriptional regulator [Streptomyces sp. NBC_00878]MCX4903948.1 helix-turn-helix transcriptional regulator [Streptomyces sp. NBC_00878]